MVTNEQARIPLKLFVQEKTARQGLALPRLAGLHACTPLRPAPPRRANAFIDCLICSGQTATISAKSGGRF